MKKSRASLSGWQLILIPVQCPQDTAFDQLTELLNNLFWRFSHVAPHPLDDQPREGQGIEVGDELFVLTADLYPTGQLINNTHDQIMGYFIEVCVQVGAPERVECVAAERFVVLDVTKDFIKSVRPCTVASVLRKALHRFSLIDPPK